MTLTVPAGQSGSVNRSRRAQEKAAENRAAIERINARERGANACDLIGPRAPATTATTTPDPGQEVSTTMTPDTTATAPEAKASTTRSERTAAIAAERAKGKRGKGVAISPQALLDHIVKVRKENPDAKLGTESSYAWWVLKYAFSQTRWAELWELAGRGVTKIPAEATKPQSTTKPAKKGPAKKGPAKATKTVKKQTPGQKRASGKATPKASPSPTAQNRSASSSRTGKATSSATPSGESAKDGDRKVTTHFKEGAKAS